MPIINVSNASGFTGPSSATADQPITVAGPVPVAYTPIGFGIPLSVEILTIYTGAFKTKGLFHGNKSDILCVSGAKASETFNGTQRAINLLQHNVAEKCYLEFSAFSNAMPYVYYKNAADSNEIDITIELTFSFFNENLFDTVADLMSKAAGLPVFMPAAGKLLAGSELVSLLQSGANDLFTPSTFLNQTIPIRFDTAGMPVSKASSVLVCRDEDITELNACKVETVTIDGNTQMRLVGSDGIYNGNAPYIILNFDGAIRPELQAWTASIASSSVLSEFYGADGKMNGLSQTLQQAMGLYNDYTYFSKATPLAQQLEGMQQSDPKYAPLLAQYQAYVNNISKNSPFAAALPVLNQ